METYDKIKLLPHTPGVYRFIDKDGVIIYIGKAKDLRNRVMQYFRSENNLSRKTAIMVSKIFEIQHTVVNTEEDALLLENNLIKQFQPRYNILLKDSKTYPWICVKKEPFPRVFITRNVVKDGSGYFGPYSSATYAHNILELINGLYKLRNCKLSLSNQNIASNKFKVCLNYHLGKCCAPCVGKISDEMYRSQIDSIIEILKGNSFGLIKEYEDKMRQSASDYNFEQAQLYKERRDLLQKHYSKSLIVNSSSFDSDVFSIIQEGQDAFGNFMRIKSGSIIQSLNMEMKNKIDEGLPSVLTSFISEIYSKLDGFRAEGVPKDVIVPFMPDYNVLGKNYYVPVKGEKGALLELSRKNAAELKFEKLKYEEFVNPKEHSERVIENLMNDLQMTELPNHIECFDNSNIQGSNPVASCVVFKNGLPSKGDYRHFNIKTVIGPDDFASMKEVVNRRYSRLLEERGALPQLIVIDGGKGQVSSAYEALTELGLIDKIKLIGIAKRLEELIIPGDPYPMFLDKNSTSLRLIMQLRDEAHRFGITHHRNRRSKSQLSSEIESIEGIGKVSADKLLSKYKTLSKIKSAPYNEVVKVIGKRIANVLFDYFGLEKI